MVEEMTNWLYGRSMEINTRKKEDIRHCLSCYSFAEKRMMVGFKNTLADALRASFKKTNMYVHVSNLVTARQLQLETTPMYAILLRSFLCGMVHDIARWIQGGEHAQDLAQCLEPPAVGKELVQEMLKCLQVPYRNPAELKGCHFHDQTAVAARGRPGNT